MEYIFIIEILEDVEKMIKFYYIIIKRLLFLECVVVNFIYFYIRFYIVLIRIFEYCIFYVVNVIIMFYVIRNIVLNIIM